MAEWWVVHDTSSNTYSVVEQNPPAPAGAVNDLPYFNQASADSASAALNKSAKAGVVNTLKAAIPNPLSGILPTLTNTRGLAVRAVKVVAGLALVFIGLNMLAKETTNVDVISAVKSLPKVVPV